ncbi:hypothetical protein L249_8052 [Ophiocordyceps polyrhachis-furcata BCC 54312]|uniref:Plasma membrane channel protein n=1 Tax=Ophiocordyceps polyrhachis-furcata BCC 54312 TaxID=1330021 RepID=A0A367LI04_9HYPO|nr:hypothetical protein L249_8052 [Ophiocordyceps polyrhachis-furcata BCC 54312]
MASLKIGSDQHNLGVDYVILFKVPPQGRAHAEAAFVQAIEALSRVGLSTTVRRGGDSDSLLIFVRAASARRLGQQVRRSRMQDWLHGVRTAGTEADAARALEEDPVTEAERLRIVHQLITQPVNEGGAGVATSSFVQSVFPLRDQAFNRAWIQEWSQKQLLEQRDIDEIRNKFGESVALYFAFLRSYSTFIVFPAALGFSAWLLLGQFSYTYALGCGLWSVVFIEYWKKKEVDLAVQWGVRGVSSIQHQRPGFKWEFETEDLVTGEPRKVYPYIKRLQTQLLQIPFALASIVVLGGLVVFCNSLEIFINEVYDGPFKQYLAFLPTVFLVVLTPTFSSILMRAATVLTERENYETVDAYHAALVQKQFVLNFFTSYMALLFTTFVYIPFGETLLPLLEFWRRIAQAVVSMGGKTLSTQRFQINPQRIGSQMFYLTVTAQIVNFATEVIVPYVTHKAVVKAHEFQVRGPRMQEQDDEEEAEFLKRVREECLLEEYDVTADYREMVMQYGRFFLVSCFVQNPAASWLDVGATPLTIWHLGYLSLFSVAWPLAACCFLVNNWVELRSDALKIASSCKRPIPWRSDSIGPWLTALGFLSWLGSITSGAIVYLCSHRSQHGTEAAATTTLTAWGGLVSVALAEHLYLLAQLAVRYVMSKMDSPGLQRERRERYQMKRKLLEESVLAEDGDDDDQKKTEKVTRQMLEEEARKASIVGERSAEDMFWQRQRGAEDVIVIGRRLIEKGAASDKVKTKPQPSPRSGG